jgi:hypothetical protein
VRRAVVALAGTNSGLAVHAAPGRMRWAHAGNSRADAQAFRALIAGRDMPRIWQEVAGGFQRPCLLCAEKTAEQCHRLRRISTGPRAAEEESVTVVYGSPVCDRRAGPGPDILPGALVLKITTARDVLQ